MGCGCRSPKIVPSPSRSLQAAQPVNSQKITRKDLKEQISSDLVRCSQCGGLYRSSNAGQVQCPICRSTRKE